MSKKPHDHVLTLRLRQDQRQKIDSICEKEEIPRSIFIRRAIRHEMERAGEQAA